MSDLKKLARSAMQLRFKQLSLALPLQFLRNANNSCVESAWIDGFEHGFEQARELAAKKADFYAPDDTDGQLGKLIRKIGRK